MMFLIFMRILVHTLGRNPHLVLIAYRTRDVDVVEYNVTDCWVTSNSEMSDIWSECSRNSLVDVTGVRVDRRGLWMEDGPVRLVRGTVTMARAAERQWFQNPEFKCIRIAPRIYNTTIRGTNQPYACKREMILGKIP